MADTTILGLCAGVGMLDEGIAAGLRYLGRRPKALGYVERDAYAASVLLARMASKALEPAPVWAGNLEAVRWEQFTGAVDILCAGFPCQPHSMAGSRKGTDDARWIWPAIKDCIRVVRPRIVLLENVSGLRSSGGMAPVLADLAALGFRVEWDSIRASDVGASHQRERVFILAVDDADGAEWRSCSFCGSGFQQGIDCRREENCGAGVAGSPCLGNPGLQHQYPEQRSDGSEYPGAGGELADPGQPGLQGGEQQSAHDKDGRTDGRTEQEPCRSVTQFRDVPLFAPGPNDERWKDIITEYPDLAPATQSPVRGFSDGLAAGMDEYRADRLRCGGNGVVPLQAGLAFVTLARRAGIA